MILITCFSLRRVSRWDNVRPFTKRSRQKLGEGMMSFAVQLYFDPVSDTAIRSLWETLASAGAPFSLRDSGNRPHFSLGLYKDLDIPACTGLLNSFAQTQPPFPLSIASLGIFHSEKTVVFLAPVANSYLLDLHKRVHQLFQDTVKLPDTRYLPEHWTPHCALATRVPSHFLAQAITICCGISFPFSLSIEEIGIIEYPPVTHLCSFRLAGL